MSLGVAGLSIAGPYEKPSQGIVDAVLWQVYYRTFGLVGTHVGVQESFEAAQFLSERGRGGTVKWLIPGRLFLWSDIRVAPAFPDSPTMMALFAGSGTAQFNTAISRVGFWLPRILRRLRGGGPQPG